MKQIEIKTKSYERKYPVIIGKNILETVSSLIDLKWHSSVVIITDSNIPEEFINNVKKSLDQFANNKLFTFKFEAGEKNKNLETVKNIYEFFAEKKLDRKSIVINIGGGVTTDMGGFAASTYMRGIPFINVPTTLEAMVDASVGGKTGVNLEGLKNYIGTFTQPKGVVIDISTLKTVPEKALIQGFAEVIKHGLISDEKYFSLVSRKKLSEFSDDELIAIIYGSVKIKSSIVSEDEHESGIRKILNFGHTIGHAVESLSLKTAKPLFHGEAVAIGMVAEAKISEIMGLITADEFERIESAIKKADLPVHFDGKYEVIAKLILTDKKNQSGKVKWVLLAGIGKAEFNIEVSESYIKKGIEYIIY
jgi:3-dehydroquinate synthase